LKTAAPGFVTDILETVDNATRLSLLELFFAGSIFKSATGTPGCLPVVSYTPGYNRTYMF